MKTSRSHPIRVDFVDQSVHGFSGKLGITFAPGKSDGYRWDRDLEADLDVLKHQFGLEVLISLMQDFEYDMLKIPTLVDRATERGIEVIRFSIEDVASPRDDEMTDFVVLLDRMQRALADGKTVVAHCRGGLGRAGTVVASLLVYGGMPASVAVDRVRLARPGAIEVRSQVRWIGKVEAHLKQQ